MRKITEETIIYQINEFKNLERWSPLLNEAKQNIKFSDVEFIITCVNTGIPFTRFFEYSTVTRRASTTIIHYFLKNLYTEEELVDYVKLCLSNYINSKDYLFPIKSTDTMRYVYGQIYSHNRNQYEELFKKVFNNAFKQIVEHDYWNKTCIDKLIDAMQNGEDIIPLLTHILESSRPTSHLITLYDKYIIPKIGLNAFREYLEVRAKEYYDSLDHDVAHKNVFFAYFQNILGIIPEHPKKGSRYDSDCIMCGYKVFLQYIPLNVSLNASVKALKLSPEEIEGIKKKRNALPLRETSVSHNYSYSISSDSYMHYGDITLKDICSYIDVWFELRKTGCRQTFQINSISNDLLNDCSDELIKKNIHWAFYSHTNPEYKSYIHAYIQNKTLQLKEYYYNTNAEELSEDKDYYILAFKNKDGFVITETFDLTQIKSNLFKDSLRLYIRHEFNNQRLFVGERRNRYFNLITPFINYIEHTFNIDRPSHIKRIHIQSYLAYKSSLNQLNPHNLKCTLGGIRSFYNVLIQEPNSHITINPVETVQIRYIEEHFKSTPVIPEEILVFLDNHIDECPDKQTVLMYKIMSWTAFRFGDAKTLCIDGLTKIDDNHSIITVETSKTKTALENNGLDSELTDIIPTGLYNELREYINKTSKRRKQYKTDLCFFRILNGKVATIDDTRFIRVINAFLEEHDVMTIDKEYWNLTTRQPRKTVAYTLINNGSSISDVQQKLNHITNRSTKKYYAEVRRMNLAELNHEFYKKKFGYLISEDRLNLYSEEERRHLYEDFCLNTRITELGVCSLHPTEGRCEARINGSCATCSKICTGVRWLDSWQSLFEDSLRYIEELKRIYEVNHIPESQYKTFIEYKQEMYLLNHYREVIKSIKDNK